MHDRSVLTFDLEHCGVREVNFARGGVVVLDQLDGDHLLERLHLPRLAGELQDHRARIAAVSAGGLLADPAFAEPDAAHTLVVDPALELVHLVAHAQYSHLPRRTERVLAHCWGAPWVLASEGDGGGKRSASPSRVRLADTRTWPFRSSLAVTRSGACAGGMGGEGELRPRALAESISKPARICVFLTQVNTDRDAGSGAGAASVIGARGGRTAAVGHGGCPFI